VASEIRLHPGRRHGACSIGEHARLDSEAIPALRDDPGADEVPERPRSLVLRETRALRDARDARLPEHDGSENAAPLLVGEMAKKACG